MSVAWPTGVQLVFFFCVGQLTQSVSPGFLFIRMFIMIYLFVLDDSLTS